VAVIADESPRLALELLDQALDGVTPRSSASTTAHEMLVSGERLL
jgi:hypothetical protein